MAQTKTTTSIPDEVLINKIHLIRGQKVILDRDLAELYGVETKRLKEQVNRNLDRFPKHFMFILTNKENNSLRSQIATLKQGAHTRSLPYAFTEHGVLMLSNVLKSSSAIKMSIKIIDIFIKLREMLSTHKDILLKLEQLEKHVSKNSAEIQFLFGAIKQLVQEPAKPRKRIGFRIENKK